VIIIYVDKYQDLLTASNNYAQIVYKVPIGLIMITITYHSLD